MVRDGMGGFFRGVVARMRIASDVSTVGSSFPLQGGGVSGQHGRLIGGSRALFIFIAVPAY